jgi:hypothetical protein
MSQDPNTFFTQIQRISLVNDILERITISGKEMRERQKPQLHKHGDNDLVGLSYLLKQGVYDAAYPLHDGDAFPSLKDKKVKPHSKFPLRPWLREIWARPGRWLKFQPLDDVRRYFGEKVAIYFGWLGFYTRFLVPLTAMGLLIFLIGLFTYPSDPVVLDYCSRNISQTIICRKCGDKVCPFTVRSTLLHTDCFLLHCSN